MLGRITSVPTPMGAQLREQNAIALWATCPDRGRRHQWERREVSPRASDRARERGRLEGWYVCHQTWCPAARFGKGDSQVAYYRDSESRRFRRPGVGRQAVVLSGMTTS